MTFSPENNPQIKPMQNLWQSEWAAQHDQWQEPTRWAGVFALGDSPETASNLDLFVQKSIDGSSSRLFAVEEGTDKTMTLEYDLQEKKMLLDDPQGIMQGSKESILVMLEHITRSEAYAHQADKNTHVDRLQERQSNSPPQRGM